MKLSLIQWCEWKQKYWRAGRDVHERLGQAFLNDFPDFGPNPKLFYEKSVERAEAYIMETHIDWLSNQVKSEVK